MPKRRQVMLASFGAILASSVLAASSIGEVSGTVVFDQTFSVTGNTGGEFPVSVPAGVRAIDVTATGGNGGSIANIQGVTANGGRGARVSGRIAVTPSTGIWVEVGGNGTGNTFNTGEGGFNGGGDALEGPAFPGFYNPGAGGGGASDVRTQPRGVGLSPDPRLIVAGGGGGAGKPENGTTTTGGGHGGAGFSAGAAGAAGTDGIGGADGGQPGSSSGGGAGGTTGPSGGTDGTGGSLGQGGNGGFNPDNTPSGGGGGGGGGRYGGGGGHSGGSPSFGGGGGGGGGGSSLVPAGGTVEVAPAGSQPSVRVQYTIPNTGIAAGPGPATSDTTPAFTFEASEAGATFECRIDSTNAGDYAPCTASFTAPEQDEGSHKLDVRAVNTMGNFDATPATSTFVVDTTAPTTTISGPETTTSPTPAFTYSAEPGSAFRCAFDSAPLAECPAAGVTAPPLALGAHTLAVEATDAAGNVEAAPAIKAFTVLAPPPPGGDGAETPRCGGEPADIVGTDGNDRLRGTGKSDTIAGLDGNDKINGRGGKDVICGGDGKDELSGGGGKDRCLGGKGKDEGAGCERGKV